MSKQEAIRNAARAVKAHGLSLPAELDKQIADLENPQYRVAVVGDFQVGKSTLINRVFLGDKPLLAEGEGIPKTAVATDIEYGSAPTLEVYDWVFDIPGNDTKDPPMPPQTSRTAETLVKTVPNPTKDDVNEVTTSSENEILRNEEIRTELAKKRARVVVKVPNDALRGFTVVDTPGLDDPNQELLLDTTWRIIPGADVALLVVRGDQQLGDTQLNLLRKEIMGKNGVSRLMVLASFKPSIMQHNAEGRAKLVETIKARLANSGRENIPVEMYCFEPAIEDIWNNATDLQQLIKKFLDKNALPGREEKVTNLVRVELEKDLTAIAAKLATSGKSDAERAALAAKVETEVARFKEKAERAYERFQSEIKSLDDDMMNEVSLAVEVVFEKFYTDLSNQSSVGAMKKVLDKANTTIKSDLQDKLSIIGLKLKAEIESLVKHYGNDMEEARQNWRLFVSDEFQIKTGFVAKIPTFVYEAISIALLNLVLPFGWITAIVGRLLSKSFMDPLSWLGKQGILSQVKSGLEESKPETTHYIMQTVHEGIEKTFADVKTAMEASNKAQVEAIRSALATEPADSGDRAALESAKADLESALAAL